MRPALLLMLLLDDISLAAHTDDISLLMLVKMDWCGGATDVRGSYVAMSKALNESGRHIALNMCRGDTKPWSWIFPLAQSWRVTADHSGTWTEPGHGIKQGIETAMKIPREATGKPYGWNDLDMLQTGTGPASG